MNILNIIFMLLLIFFNIIFFCVRKKNIGTILYKLSSSNTRYIYLIMGLYFLFVLGIGELIFHIKLKGYLSDLEIILVINYVLIGTFLITMFFTSKIYFGSEGVLVPTMPFFIPRYQITNYSISSNAIILEREKKKSYRLKIKTKDVKKIEQFIDSLNKNG